MLFCRRRAPFRGNSPTSFRLQLYEFMELEGPFKGISSSTPEQQIPLNGLSDDLRWASYGELRF